MPNILLLPLNFLRSPYCAIVPFLSFASNSLSSPSLFHPPPQPIPSTLHLSLPLTHCLPSLSLFPPNTYPPLPTFPQAFLLPELNKHIEKGFPLPIVDGVSFVNPEVKFADSYLYIGTDVHYNSSTTTAARNQPKPVVM